MQILVAGNRGFLGSNLQRALLASGLQVHGADRGEVLRAIAATSPSILIWAAGSRSPDVAAMEEQHLYAPLEALRAASPERFIYLSTGEIYGPQAVPFDEQLEPNPRSPYAQIKLRAEGALTRSAADQGTTLIILRLAVAYGPGQRGRMFIPTLIDSLRRQLTFPMTPGEQTRDFLYIDDATDAVRRALNPTLDAGIFNIGSEEETRLLEAAHAIARALGQDRERLLEPGAVPYRPNEQMRYLLGISRARQVLGFSPHVSLEEGIRRCVAGA